MHPENPNLLVQEAPCCKKSKFPASFRTQAGFPASMKKTGIALGVSTAMLLPVGAGAADAGAGDEVEMKAVTVVERVIDHNPYAEPDAPYKAKFSGDERHRRPLLKRRPIFRY